MSRVRVCFFGTPPFARTALQGLLEDEHYEVVGVVTQPDRPAGRKMKLQPSAVKTLTLEKGLPVLTPEKLNREPEIIDEIAQWRCDIGVVVAFGQILSDSVLNMFTHGSVNLHGSLLPRWRGAAPIQRAMEAGDKETGVCLQKMVKKLDAGDVLGERRVSITDDMDAMDLHDNLAELGVELLHIEMMDFIRGNLTAKPQDESLVTYAHKIEKAECEIDWSLTAGEIFNKIRGFQMGPGCFTELSGKKIKIHKSKALRDEAAMLEPGCVQEITESEIKVATGDGLLELLIVQPASKPKMPVEDFLRGHEIKKGERFGN